MESGDLLAGLHGDVGVGLDAVGQIARHGAAQIGATDDERDRTFGPGQEHGGLAGGIAPADDHHRRSADEACLGLGGGVVDARPLEGAEARDGQAPVVGAGSGRR